MNLSKGDQVEVDNGIGGKCVVEIEEIDGDEYYGRSPLSGSRIGFMEGDVSRKLGV